jgi:hypothetical protein
MEALRRFVLHLDPSHPGQGRSLVAPLDELGHRVGVTFGYDLDAPIGQVARPAGNAQSVGLVLAAAAEPYSLYSSADPKVAAYHRLERYPALPSHPPVRSALLHVIH